MIDRDRYLDAARYMEQYGGSFASHIAKAFIYADSDNTQRLLKAFPDLFLRYRRIAEEERQRAQQD
jgi:hypothetical protein